MDEVSVQDLTTYFKNTVAMVKGRPWHILQISRDKTLQGKDLLTGEVKAVAYDPRVVTGPTTRLGMVNINGVAYYLKRRPVRRYQVGISAENTRPYILDGVNYNNAAVDNRVLNNVHSIEVANTLIGKFPSFQEALISVKQFGGVVAFDRQFAIDEERNIYFKTKRVGRLPRMVSNPDHIVFNKGYEYLSCIVTEVTYEKAKRASGYSN